MATPAAESVSTNERETAKPIAAPKAVDKKASSSNDPSDDEVESGKNADNLLKLKYGAEDKPLSFSYTHFIEIYINSH